MKNALKQISKIGLIANQGKGAAAATTAQRAARLIAQTGRVALADEVTCRLARLNSDGLPSAAALARAVDALLVFGGDGTMLRVVKEIDGAETPILGINVGTLGFLTAAAAKELGTALESLWRNDFLIDTRWLMEAAGVCSGKSAGFHAFNDVVISHGAVSRLIELDVSVDGEPLTRYRGDGLIVCTPGGSTAYSLSAGGPIISPTADVFAITPICAHALSNRSVIISQSSTVQVRLLSEKMETIVAADGRVEAALKGGDALNIFRSRRKARLIVPASSSFFDAVRRKLGWSGSAV